MAIFSSFLLAKARSKPFLDKDFVQYYLSIPAKMKIFDGKMRLEKHLLRKAFNESNLLPDVNLWRQNAHFLMELVTKKTHGIG